MSLLDPDPTPKIAAHLGKWFLCAASLGVLLGVLVFIPAIFDLLGDRVLFVFPASIAGIAEPRTIAEKALLLLLEFGSQFLLYGSFGLAVGFALYVGRTLRPRRRGVNSENFS